MEEEKTIKVFVFGILKSNMRAFHERQCLSVEKDTLPDHLMYSVGGSYPASIKGDGIIHGETHTYQASMLDAFDRIEGYNAEDHNSPSNLYTRETAVTGNGHHVSYYLFNRSVEGLTLIESGVWE